ncbi:carotenoid ester lipase precursor [Coniophora puteana RWD-64-598 SS2]|uniref:Carboxylic ester hydrolase n=1 Tax=Coniophora puteana (strain RWD-64-598) TaxID=741705 RepID=A0A5M3MS77_CONPW|nr:carotenoid ester lipase precursor [Coniophora puteana RWD-64-598 SS2]EIW81505.1 carotenoid ester lipase precursor [Coniophora puteana RWD-64-598 SS2]
MLAQCTLFVLLLQVTSSWAVPTRAAKRAGPTVRLDDATVTGVANGTVNKFLGIPYVQPPIGSLRLRQPHPITSYNQSFSATTYGPICPQQLQKLVLPDDVPAIVSEEMGSIGAPVDLPISEDCLTVNIIAPADATPDSKLPVVLWIFGGGFEIGYPSSTDGSILVNQSVSLGTPVVYVSLNYRLNIFGFLASEEVQDAGIGNLGLQDQRQAMRWFQQYITQFGGDPSKVTIWGESAGAISVGAQLVANKGNNEGLFRAAIMDSGAPLWLGNITHGQPYYDHIVDETGCSNSSDTLDCLRNAPFEALMSATNSTPNMFSYQALATAWIPRVDGVFLTDNPQQLVKQGSIADVPFINGVNDDEGTLFSFTTLNVTTDDELLTYIQTYYAPNATSDEIEHVLSSYSSDPVYGSPFNTSNQNALTPQFKRIAAVLGDMTFQGPHRFLLQERSAMQPTWAYLYKRGKSTPYLGSDHGSELTNAYGGGDLAAYFIRFVANLDPNGNNVDVEWPKYTTDSPSLLTLLDGDIPLNITQDDYRVEAIQAMNALMLKYPF